MPPSIHHVQIAMPAGGEDLARAFYGELLGLVEIRKPESLLGRGGVWFRTGTIELHLGVDPSFAPASKAHIAIEVVSLSDVRARLVKASYPVQQDVPLPGIERFHTTDPFGNRTEIVMRART